MKCVTFLLIALFLCGCTNKIVLQEIQQTQQQTPIQQMAVYYEGEQKEKITFEPEQRKILLGAFIKQDKNIESMEYFEKLTEKKHEIYGFTTTLTEEFPMMDILECYVNKKIPLLVIQPADRNFPFEQEYLEEAAEKANQYRIPMLIDFYPNGEDYSNGEDYKKYYQKAREIFKEKAPNTVFIWTMSIENIENWYAYYPQNADWIGLSIYENGGNQGKDIAEMLERWYAIFQKQKPLILSHVGISHYSEKNSKYTEKEASDEIKRLYESIKAYPEIKAIVYDSVNLTRQYGMQSEGENYSIVENEKVLNAYREQIQNIECIDKEGIWYKSFYKGYIKDNKIYVAKNTIIQEMETYYNNKSVIYLYGKEYVPAEDIKGYTGKQQQNAIFLYKQLSE
ncbi:hypothetical protein AAK894_00900 [Lachnospiraceae bacterium 46-61]